MSYLEKTTSGMSDGNLKIWTLSFWMKRAKLGSEQFLWSWGENNSNDGKLLFGSGDQLVFMNDGQCGSNQTMTRALRDTNGWYHIVWRCKADEGSNDNRWKLYINGELIPASEYGSPSISNADGIVNKWSTQDCWHGGNARSQQSGSINPFYGTLSHIHFCDGYAYDASDFGETDATTGEWKIKTNPSVSYGTNGYFILKNGNSGTDESPNSNNFTTVGTITKTEDNPSHVFATINPLQAEGGGSPALTFSNGNTKVTRSGNWRGHLSTLGANKGKYYWEIKCTGNVALGIAKFGGDADSWSYMAGGQSWLGDKNDVWILYNNASSQVKYTGASSGGNWGTVTGDGEVVMIAFDADNGIIWTGNNGTWHESATEAEIEAGTTTNAMYSGISIGSDFFGSVGAVENGNLEYNFGNGYFGDTAISSEGTNASGIGKFEFNVPDGFTALSTKGLNE